MGHDQGCCVGVGRVAGPRLAAKDFEIDGKPTFDVLQGNHLREDANDPERCEYFVPVQLLHTEPEAQEVGMFGSQNTVGQPKTPKWRTTVEQLKARFGVS